MNVTPPAPVATPPANGNPGVVPPWLQPVPTPPTPPTPPKGNHA